MPEKALGSDHGGNDHLKVSLKVHILLLKKKKKKITQSSLYDPLKFTDTNKRQ